MNKYEVLGVVGEGAYGIVLRCRNKESGEIVAVKKYKESDEDEIVRKTTLREVKMLRSLRQENIVSLKEAFRRKQKLYLVFEYVDRSLLEVLEEQPAGVSPIATCTYIFQLLRALDYCHANNVAHRDIKPENLLIQSEPGEPGKLKLCDFGFARTLPPAGQSLTDYVSTRWYRAPELLLGFTRYGPEVDVWAVGCIMAELIDGQALFQGDSDVDQLYIIQRLLGPITRRQTAMFLANRRFAGFRFGDDLAANPESLAGRYRSKIKDGSLSPEGLDFLQRCLKMEPAERMTTEQCLQHAYFAGFASTGKAGPAIPQRAGSSRRLQRSPLRTPNDKQPGNLAAALERGTSQTAASLRLALQDSALPITPVKKRHEEAVTDNEQSSTFLPTPSCWPQSPPYLEANSLSLASEPTSTTMPLIAMHSKLTGRHGNEAAASPANTRDLSPRKGSLFSPPLSTSRQLPATPVRSTASQQTGRQVTPTISDGRQHSRLPSSPQKAPPHRTVRSLLRPAADAEEGSIGQPPCGAPPHPLQGTIDRMSASGASGKFPRKKVLPLHTGLPRSTTPYSCSSVQHMAAPATPTRSASPGQLLPTPRRSREHLAAPSTPTAFRSSSTNPSIRHCQRLPSRNGTTSRQEQRMSLRADRLIPTPPSNSRHMPPVYPTSPGSAEPWWGSHEPQDSAAGGSRFGTMQADRAVAGGAMRSKSRSARGYSVAAVGHAGTSRPLRRRGDGR